MQAPTVLPATEDALRSAADRLAAGGLVAFPTETVYGLGAHAWDAAAVAAIFARKGRPATHPLIVHVADVAGARAVTASFPPAAEALAAAFWPGPLTLVLPAHPDLPAAVTAGGATVGVRVPAHPVARALLDAFGGPIAAPSANRHQEVSPTAAAHVTRSLGGDLLVLDGGRADAGIESTVLSLVTQEILRPGPIPPAALRAFVPGLRAREGLVAGAGAHASPGLSARHYAPKAPLTIVHPDDLAAAAGPGIFALLRRPHPAFPAPWGRVLGEGPDAYAHELFAALVACDEAGARGIVAEALPEDEAFWALRDRLARAAVGRPFP